MKKIRFIIDFKKEEDYLRDMAKQGWEMVHYNFCKMYTFEKIRPEARNYRIDYQTFKKKADYMAYLTLFEDSGWQHVSGNRGSGVHFFLAKNGMDLDSDIFSDDSSRNERHKRLYSQAMVMGVLTMIYLLILQPSFKGITSWYLTPSIWDYSGPQLVGMVIMQTFFLVLPFIPLLFLAISALYNLMVGTKVKRSW